MYSSKIGSENFRLTVEQFVSSLSQRIDQSNIKCEKLSSYDNFNRDSYSVVIKRKKAPKCKLVVSDETCTNEDYDRGCNVYMVSDEYGDIERSWNLMLECPGYTGDKVACYIKDMIA